MKNYKNQEYTIIQEIKDSGRTFCVIKYKDTNNITKVRKDVLTTGHFKDKMSPSLYGVASIGDINTRQHWKEYKVWNDMISRCYSNKDKSYKYYGAKGVIVSPKWLIFENFYKDIPKIEGFDETLFNQGKLKLDKDIKSGNQKIYSLENCIFVSDLENQKQRAKEYNSIHKKFAIFPDGHIEQIFHVSDFCKQYNLHRQNVNLCLQGKQNQTKGFKFYRSE